MNLLSRVTIDKFTLITECNSACTLIDKCWNQIGSTARVEEKLRLHIVKEKHEHNIRRQQLI